MARRKREWNEGSDNFKFGSNECYKPATRRGNIARWKILSDR